MRFSIVTISYNQVRFLEQAIRSVIEQDYQDIEYIVVDPGSTDGSRELIGRYRERIDKVVFEPDTGPADGLNKGFSIATGDIYGFLNSDDLLLQGALSNIRSAFDKMPAVDVISGHTFVIDENDQKLCKFYSRYFSLFRYAYGAATLAQQSTFFRSTAYKKTTGFNVSNSVTWDGELWFDMARSGAKFSTYNKILSCFRLYQGSITGSKRLKEEQSKCDKRMFKKLYGRDRNALDIPIHYYAKSLEYFQQPWILVERLMKGRTVK